MRTLLEQSQTDFNSLVESVLTLLDDIAAQCNPLEAHCKFVAAKTHNPTNLIRNAAICEADVVEEQKSLLGSKLSALYQVNHSRNILGSNAFICGLAGKAIKHEFESVLSVQDDIHHLIEPPLSPTALINGKLAPVKTEKQVDHGCKKHSSKAGSFPSLLYDLLEDSEKDGFIDLISWQNHGRAFRVNNPKQFAADIMSRYFHQTRYTSFQRQLALYGFLRIRTGKDRGAYYHKQFKRGKKSVCIDIQRIPIKGAMAQHLTKLRVDPNFYAFNSVNDFGHETAYL
jgi:HSF-type DNA-binding